MTKVILNGGGGSNGCTSLRKTLSSEDSVFLASYNEAQDRSLRKEVEIWYKYTRNTLRSMSDDQRKLYQSLLKLSRKKKSIKVERGIETSQTDSRLRTWRQTCNRRHSTLLSGHSHSLTTIEENENAEDEVTEETNPLTKFESLAKLSEEGNEDDMKQENSTKTAFDRLSSDEQNKLFEFSNNTKAEENFENKSLANDLDNAIDTRIEDQRSTVPSTVFQMKSSTEISDDKNLYGILTTPKMAITTCDCKPQSYNNEHLKSPKREARRIASTFSFDNIISQMEIDTSRSLASEKLNRNPKIPPLPPINSAQQNERDIPSKPDQQLVNATANHARIPQCQRKIRHDGRRACKKRLDPTVELNTKSSIQAMEGRMYQVPSYRKEVGGSLREETKTINTTIDVSEYFNFRTHRDRHIRKELLAESKLIGREQRKRVSEFLRKLNQGEEEMRAKAEMKAKKMAEEIENRKQVELGPPRYGLLSEDTVAPGYVRKYKRRSSVGTDGASLEKRRSSWCIPSLHTLQMRGPASNRSLFCCKKTNQVDRTLDIEQMKLSFSAHLVDIKLDRYTKANAAA